jgi:UDP-2,3-diacylglucosamine hydrolase
MTDKKIYFISDLHLGYPTDAMSREREKKIVQWLKSIQADCGELFLVGDIFDFWHEWRYVVPKGFVRFLATIAEFADSGIPVHFFTGNHDIWSYRYMKDEIGAEIYTHPQIFERQGKQLYIAHGDGLGPGDWSYRLLKSIFTNKILQFFFARLHPNASMWFGQKWSRGNRYREKLLPFLGENEWLIQYSRDYLTKNSKINYFIYGHRHVPSYYPLNEQSVYINLGQWINQFNYGVMADGEMQLLRAF